MVWISILKRPLTLGEEVATDENDDLEIIREPRPSGSVMSKTGPRGIYIAKT